MALADVHARFPDVAVRLRSAPLGGPLVAVRDGSADLGIPVSDEIRDPSLAMAAAGSVTLIAVAAPGHPLTKLPAPVDVSAQLTILIADPTDVTEGVEYGAGGARLWRVDDLEAKRSLIAAGVGWGNMPEHLVRQDLEARRLARVAPLGIGPCGETRLPVYLLTRNGAPPGPALAAFNEAYLGAMTEAVTPS